DKAGAKQQDSKPATTKKKSGGSRTEVVKAPSLDGFDDVPVIEISVAEGDTIGEDDPLVTVESDKATMEIPSPYAGKVGKILVKEGDKLSERSEEHTSELQSRENLVCRLLLEKKKQHRLIS